MLPTWLLRKEDSCLGVLFILGECDDVELGRLLSIGGKGNWGGKSVDPSNTIMGFGWACCGLDGLGGRSIRSFVVCNKSKVFFIVNN